MSEDIVNIEVNGETVQARKGQMLIEATDKVGAYVPRFCYHEKLSIAANCRMCLVEVEKAPKPLPACATPVTEGMKVFTRSPKAISAQKATMEFLLINHPLDCPICDQGGECELQDLSIGFGSDVSRYTERKRVVKDKSLGSLVSTDMTRCIHCTRCVRFGEEISGIPELGTCGRGENVKISTFIEKSIDHELSANIIDLCPVGALNSKPYRFSARAWEMEQRPTIATHDCVGSNIYAHVLRGKIKRVVPRANEAINETWISDRDRFSYEGIYSGDRLLTPRVKRNGQWQDIEWDEALQELAAQLQNCSGDDAGILASPSSTLEEFYLLARLADKIGTANIDHRLRQQDFSDQSNDPVFPWLGCGIADIEDQKAILVVGSNLRKEAPILAHRVRKAALGGASVNFLNSEVYPYFFSIDHYLQNADLVAELASVAVAAAKVSGKQLPAAVKELCAGAASSSAHEATAKALLDADNGLIFSGLLANGHMAFAAIRRLIAAIAELTGSSFGNLSEGANSAGAHLAGVLPHRGIAGKVKDQTGASADQILATATQAVLLFNVEPDKDLSQASLAKLAGKKCVAAFTPFVTESLAEAATLLLPIGTFAETSGTYVNVEGRWQSVAGVATPVGDARPGWKVLRVLGNLLDIDGFEFVSSEEIRDELKQQLGTAVDAQAFKANGSAVKVGKGAAVQDVPIYQVDAIVRRAAALQRTPEALRTTSGEAE
jgi:NADH-quinone oxidoreductase subunit G